MSNLKEILEGVWEGYKLLVVWIVTVYIILIIIVGGSFKIQIDWKNVTDCWNTLTNNRR